MHLWRFSSLPRTTLRRRLNRFISGPKKQVKTRKQIVEEEEIRLTTSEKLLGKVQVVPAAFFGVGFMLLPLFYYNYSYLMRRINHDPTAVIEEAVEEEIIEEEPEAIILEVPESPHLIKAETTKEGDSSTATNEGDSAAGTNDQSENASLKTTEPSKDNSSREDSNASFQEQLFTQMQELYSNATKKMETATSQDVFNYITCAYLVAAVFFFSPAELVKAMHASSTNI